jgi:hypothetical protein
MNMVSRLSQYISMHLAWLKEGHLRAGMDDLATTKFKLLALLTGYFPCLYSLVYCTWSQHVCANSNIHILFALSSRQTLDSCLLSTEIDKETN